MVNWHRDELVHEHTPGVGCLHHSKEETHQKLVPGQIIIKLSSDYYQIIIKLSSNYYQIIIKLLSNYYQIIMAKRRPTKSWYIHGQIVIRLQGMMNGGPNIFAQNWSVYVDSKSIFDLYSISSSLQCNGGLTVAFKVDFVVQCEIFSTDSLQPWTIFGTYSYAFVHN